MAINKFNPHVMVLPEDDANRQMANGFLLNSAIALNSIQCLPPAGGWKKVLDAFQDDHMSRMRQYANRFMVLLIDFDGDQNRLQQFQDRIPLEFQDRVFVLGTWSEPEELKRDLRLPFEKIGEKLASECEGDTTSCWDHRLLRHNSSELRRLIAQVRPILFP